MSLLIKRNISPKVSSARKGCLQGLPSIAGQLFSRRRSGVNSPDKPALDTVSESRATLQDVKLAAPFQRLSCQARASLYNASRVENVSSGVEGLTGRISSAIDLSSICLIQ